MLVHPKHSTTIQLKHGDRKKNNKQKTGGHNSVMKIGQ